MKFDKQKHLLAKREATNAFRFLKSTSSDSIDFCSNDYLGLSKNGENFEGKVVKGSGGSRLLAGNYSEIESLELYLTRFHKSESALLFNSGYNANVGFFSAVPQKGDTIIYDELIHASIKDGMRLSFAKCFSFKHNDLIDLAKKIDRAEGDVYIAVEAVYSMDGDVAPLEALVNLSENKNICLIVDEAHSVGVYGEKGEGLVQELKLESKIPIRVVTFGKAIGAHGAVVLSNSIVKDFLINYCRSFIYTTALPPYSVSSIQSSYKELESGDRTSEIRDRIRYFKLLVSEFDNINLIDSSSAIQCVICPGNKEVKEVSEKLSGLGFIVPSVLSPTVPEGKERLRICLHVFNSESEIKRLVIGLAKTLS